MAEAHWYVVHTYSGYENKVKVDIEKTIENRGLQDQILEVSVADAARRGVEKRRGEEGGQEDVPRIRSHQHGDE